MVLPASPPFRRPGSSPPVLQLLLLFALISNAVGVQMSDASGRRAETEALQHESESLGFNYKVGDFLEDADGQAKFKIEKILYQKTGEDSGRGKADVVSFCNVFECFPRMNF